MKRSGIRDLRDAFPDSGAPRLHPGYLLANSQQWPQWYKDSEFRAKRQKEMHK